MATIIQSRRGTTAEHAVFTGAVGEITVDTTKDTAVVHDNFTAGGHPLAKEAGNSSQVFSVGTATSAAHALQYGQMQYPWRNRIINGDMSVSQINGTTAVTPATSDWFSDNWYFATNVASKLTFQQVVDAPAGFKYSTKVTVATAHTAGAAEHFQFRTALEGQNLIDISFGSADAKRIAISLWIKGSIAGTYSIGLRNGATDRTYIGTISVTTSWAKQTVVLDVDTTGTWTTDNTVGTYLTIDLGSGTNYSTTAGTWQAGSFLRTSGSVSFVANAAATLNITGVQLEKVVTGATVGTEFEFLPYAENFKRCQQYYQTVRACITDNGSSANTKQYDVPINFNVAMRAAPTITYTAITSTLVASRTANDISVSGFRHTVIASGATSMYEISTAKADARL